ncbi:conserved hypothetical protein [Ricinus communis]|uniref:Uncharacterized protein n=1 Tax=Ricinus communis TaxID=3988 RepID=B9RS72_RICCO|nr:conserved hypothetical protein [Ricinus communis]|eukprot:XP_002516591.1 uncharacterized protein LOC8271231 [Ricinus communis]
MASNDNGNSNITATRESRRRKILERGADRLALITGRTQTLPSESDDKPDAVSSQPLDSRRQNQDPASDLSHQVNASSDGEDHGGSGYVFPRNDPTIAVRELSTETSRAPAVNEESPLVSSADQMSTVQNIELRMRTNRFVTPSQISSAITASESLRLFCSGAIALLVVLSSLGFPILGSSIISFRPLYLVLLTNLTLVFAYLLIGNQRGFERTVGGEISTPSTSQDWIEQAGKALEIGLVMQKAIDAVLMDCSVYAIIIIAGSSLAT